MGAFEIMFLPRNKFKETRFQERLKAYTHCLTNGQTYINTKAAARRFSCLSAEDR